MARFINLSGHRYGRLTVSRIAEQRTSSGKARWECTCDCGQTVTVDARNLRNGSTTSCGCIRRERASTLTVTHGLSRASEHDIWRHMRARCSNPLDERFPNYGGRGITVCDEWRSFERFYADMGPRPSPKHSIDRIDNDGPYAPWNCRWATMRQQRRNTRTNTVLSHQGQSLTLVEWSERTGISVNTLVERFRRRWSAARALTEPVSAAHSHRRVR